MIGSARPWPTTWGEVIGSVTELDPDMIFSVVAHVPLPPQRSPGERHVGTPWTYLRAFRRCLLVDTVELEEEHPPRTTSTTTPSSSCPDPPKINC